ncbi:2435_t:CDS:1, partial [Acaulospora colombiana]
DGSAGDEGKFPSCSREVLHRLVHHDQIDGTAQRISNPKLEEKSAANGEEEGEGLLSKMSTCTSLSNGNNYLLSIRGVAKCGHGRGKGLLLIVTASALASPEASSARKL